MLTMIIKKQMEIVEKNKYGLHFNCLLKRYDRLVKSEWIKVYTCSFNSFQCQRFKIICTKTDTFKLSTFQA